MNEQDRKPGIREWAKIRNRVRPNRLFKFWYSTNSGSEVMTNFMDEASAMQWLQSNQYVITAMHLQERMTSREAIAILRVQEDEDE